MRNLPKLIEVLLQIIPAEEDSLRAHLDSISDSAMYAAPEVMGQWWYAAARALDDHIGVPSKDWQLEVSRIFGGGNTVGPQEKKEECR